MTYTPEQMREEASQIDVIGYANPYASRMLRQGADAVAENAELKERVKVLEAAKPPTHECFVSHADEHMLETLLALEDLSFECFSMVAPPNRPSLDTYNRTFAVLDRHRKRLFIHPDSVKGYINSERGTAAITETKP